MFFVSFTLFQLSEGAMSELKKQRLNSIECVVTYQFTITDFEFARKSFNSLEHLYCIISSDESLWKNSDIENSL